MSFCQPQPVPPLLKVANSTQASTCKLEASIELAALVDILQRALRLPQLLCPSTLATLLSTSRQLCYLIHQYVTSISIQRLGCYQAIRQTNGIRQTDAIRQTNAIRQLTQPLWFSLTSLDLSCASLGADAMSQLFLGNWPELQRLDVSTLR